MHGAHCCLNNPSNQTCGQCQDGLIDLPKLCQVGYQEELFTSGIRSSFGDILKVLIDAFLFSSLKCLVSCRQACRPIVLAGQGAGKTCTCRPWPFGFRRVFNCLTILPFANPTTTSTPATTAAAGATTAAAGATTAAAAATTMGR